MSDFKKLKVWRKAHALAPNVHSVAAGIRGRMYGSLRSQLVRAADSIPANIVEGRNKKSDPDFARFLGYSVDSTAELEYHLLVARDMGAITQATYLSLLSQTIEVRKMLYGLISTVAPHKDEPRPLPSSFVLLSVVHGFFGGTLSNVVVDFVFCWSTSSFTQ